MEFRPHPYQEYAVNYILEHDNCGLFLDMGLGKTISALTALWDLLLNSFDIGKVLVIAPKRVAQDTWPREISKWKHLKGLDYSLVLGSSEERLRALQSKNLIYIINRENVSWLVDTWEWDFDCVVIDELSSFKSTKAQRFRSLKKVRGKIKRLIGLTGTPAPNSLLDLWPQMYLLDGGERLGRFITRFREDYFVPDKRNREIIFSYKLRAGAEKKIYQRIGDIVFSLKAEDSLKMPEYVSTVYDVAMDSKEMDIYNNFVRDMVVELEGAELDGVHAGAMSNKLLQMANGAVYDDCKNVIHIHDKKLEALEDIVESANGKPLLVAYWFKHDLARLKERFKQAREIDTSKDIRDWNSGKIPLGLIHPASAGHGLNLQEGGCNLVWFGLTWSLELYQQCNARLYRQGQKSDTVVIQHIVCKDTIDERVMKALESKNTNQNALIEAVKAEVEK